MVSLTQQTHQSESLALSRNDLYALCWLAATFSQATLQLRLFAHVITFDHAPLGIGTLIGLFALSWMLGTTLGRGWSSHGSKCLWAGLSIGVTVVGIWIMLPYFTLLQALGQFSEPVGLFILFIYVAATAVVFSAWMSTTRPWNPGEYAQLIATGFPVAALCFAWFVPYWSDLIASVGLLPLFVLDCMADVRCSSQPAQQEMAGVLPVATRSLRLEQHWQRALMLLSLLVDVLLGALFSVLPTIYSFQLFQQQQQANLSWMFAGQVSALLLCLLALPLLQCFIGSLDRSLFRRQQSRAMGVASIALVGVLGGLLELSWTEGARLALSFVLYAVSFSCWNIVVPHLLTNRQDMLQQRARWQTVLTCILIPAIGVGLDIWGGAVTMRLVGIVLALCAVLLVASCLGPSITIHITLSRKASVQRVRLRRTEPLAPAPRPQPVRHTEPLAHIIKQQRRWHTEALASSRKRHTETLLSPLPHVEHAPSSLGIKPHGRENAVMDTEQWKPTLQHEQHEKSFYLSHLNTERTNGSRKTLSHSIPFTTSILASKPRGIHRGDVLAPALSAHFVTGDKKKRQRESQGLPSPGGKMALLPI